MRSQVSLVQYVPLFLSVLYFVLKPFLRTWPMTLTKAQGQESQGLLQSKEETEMSVGLAPPTIHIMNVID